MNCPACGSVIKEVPAGISKKTGKPYEAFQVCSNKLCEWKPTQKPGYKSTLVENHRPNAPQDPVPTNQLKEKAMFFSYAKDLVVAEMAGGTPPPQPVKQVIAYFNELWIAFKGA